MALALITLSDVKKYVPLYTQYLTAAAAAAGISVDEMLTQEAELAEAEFMSFMPDVAAVTDMTLDFRRLLVIIIRYRVFAIKHGDTKFENTPRIVADYKTAIERIGGGKVGAGHFNVTSARDRIFDEGFVESNDADPVPSSVPFQED